MTTSLKEAVTFKNASGHWVVARRDYIDPSTKGGIMLPTSMRAELQKEVATGTVICVGSGGATNAGTRLDRPCTGGDRIIWSRYGERIVNEEDEGDLVAIPYQEVIGVIS